MEKRSFPADCRKKTGRSGVFRPPFFLLGCILFFLTAAAPWAFGQNGTPKSDTVTVKIEQAAVKSDAAAETETAAGSEEKAANADAAPVPAKNTAGNVPMKWLPNQKILLGAPATVLFLDEEIRQFDAEGAFGPPGTVNPADVEVTVLSQHGKNVEKKGKKSVVEPIVDGSKLTLNWSDEHTGKSEVLLQLKTPESPPVFLSFQTEVWTPNWWWMAAIVIGGLGVFLFGMKNMSEGVQLLAGPSLRRMIALFTENRFLAFGVGILTTMLLQSSSVTTVMVIGFINSQIMTLSQGIGVILGANIGTTVTGWILALKIGTFGLPLAGVSIFFFLFCKNEKVRSFAEATMGLGLVFFGLELMESGFAFLRELPEFAGWMKMFAATSFIGVVKCALVGCVLTMIVQSSAATIGITMSLAVIGAIEFPTAAALVLGENIGTTITAVLVSIGATTNARRAALFHVLFNMLGVCWVLVIFLPVFLPLVTYLADIQADGRNITFGIALAHTLFNVSNALLFLPFTKFFARFLTRLIPDRAAPRAKSITSLAIRHMETPAFAIERSRVEVQRMANGCRELGGWIQSLVADGFEDDKQIKQAFKQEEMLDTMQDEIIDFTSEMLTKNLSLEVAESAREQLRMADELETISDYLIAILKSDLKLKNDGLSIPPHIREGFDLLHEETILQFDFIMNTFAERKKSREFLDRIYANCRRLTVEVKKLRDDFLKAMSDERYDPQVIAAVNSQLNSYRRLWEHQLNIAEAFCIVR